MNKNSSFLLKKIIYCGIFVLVFSFVVRSSSFLAYAPGTGPGSYSGTAIDRVNLFSGTLSVNADLLNLSGRGSVGTNFAASAQMLWTVREPNYQGGSFHGLDPSVQAGINFHLGMLIQQRDDYFQYNEEFEYPMWGSTLKRVVYIAPDGTRTELVDVKTMGKPCEGMIVSQTCTQSGPHRGFNREKKFVSTDGSNLTYINETDFFDTGLALGYGDEHWSTITGILYKPDGTRLAIQNGFVTSMTDRNGNRTTAEYQRMNPNAYGANAYWAPYRLLRISDSAGRELYFPEGSLPYFHHPQYLEDGDFLVNPPVNLIPANSTFEVPYVGVGGASREITVKYDSLSDAIRPSLPGVGSQEDLFEEQNSSGSFPTTTYDPVVMTELGFANEQKYKFYYNRYAEVSGIDLPTGGKIHYEHDWGITNLPTSTYAAERFLYNRRVTERIVFDENNTPVSKTKYGRVPMPVSQDTVQVTEENYLPDQNGDLILNSVTKHYFYGHPLGSYAESPGNPTFRPYENWRFGREFKTEWYDANSNLLRTEEQTWQQKDNSDLSWCSSCPLPPPNNPRMISRKTTLSDSSPAKVDLKTYTYDAFNNVTDVYEYDFGDSSEGSLLRRTHTDFVTSSNYLDRYIRALPSSTWVSSDSAGSNKVSLTEYEYDNYTTNSPHAELISRSSVTGHDSVNYGTSFTYRGNVTGVTSYANAATPSGAVSAYSQYDMLGNVVKTIDGNGNATIIGYEDNFGTADDNATTNSTPSQISGYSTFAFPTSTTNPLSWVSYTQYDYFTGAAVNSQDINGLISKTIYDDDLDRPTQTVANIGTAFERQSNIVYDDANRRIETKGDLNGLNDNLIKSESFYDGLGRTYESRNYTDGGYVATKTEYDALGRTKRVTNPFRPHLSEPELWTESTYDALGRVIETQTPDGAEIKTAFDGNRTLVTDQAGKKRISKTNALGQLKEVWEILAASETGSESVAFPNTSIAHGFKTTYGYDTLNNLTNVSQGSQSRTFSYNSLSRLLSATNPESGTIGYEYDPNGNLTRKTDARGVQTDYIYDELDRVKNRNYSTPSGSPANYQASPNVTYTYDNVTNAKGKLTKVSSSVSTTEYLAFDILGRVTRSKQTTDGVEYGGGADPTKWMTYTYNLSGALIEQQYPSGRVVKNVLDSSGDLSMVKTKKGTNHGYLNYAHHFTYNAAGAVTSMQLGNGRWENTIFNSRLQPTQIALGVTQGSTNLLKLDYSYGTTQNNGNVQSQTITIPGVTLPFVQNYTYDSLNRLESAGENPSGWTQSNCDSDPTKCWKQTFKYDRYGNRNFNTTGTNTTTLPANFDPDIYNPTISTTNNRFDSGQGYSYDNAGNTTRDAESRRFTYDAENKQTKVETLDGSGNPIATVGEYVYDGDGKRVKKIVPSGETTVFVYDAGGKLIGEYSTVVQPVQDAKTVYTTNDHLGSPRINTDATGQVISRHDYHPFGEEVDRTSFGYGSDTVRKQFTGYERDAETGLDFAQARMYSNRLGRFMVPDAPFLDQWAIDPKSWNLYGYARNNPIRLIDPTGTSVDDPDFWEKFLNLWDYGYYVGNETIKELEQERRKWLKDNNISQRDANGDVRLIDVDSLSTQQVFDFYQHIKNLSEEGELQQFSADDIARAATIDPIPISGNPTGLSRTPKKPGGWKQPGEHADDVIRETTEKARKAAKGLESGRHGEWMRKAGEALKEEARQAKKRGDLPEFWQKLEAKGNELINQASQTSHKGGMRPK